MGKIPAENAQRSTILAAVHRQAQLAGKVEMLRRQRRARPPYAPFTGDGQHVSQSGRADSLATEIQGFQGIEFDAQAQAEMDAVLLSLADRRRAADAVIEEGGDDAAAQMAHDPAEPFVRLGEKASPYLGPMEPPATEIETVEAYAHEPHWSAAGADIPADWAEAIAQMEAAKAVPHIAEVKRPRRKGKAVP